MEELTKIVDIQLRRLQAQLDRGRADAPGHRRGQGSSWPRRASTRPTAPGRSKRVIQQRLANPLANLLLAGQAADGSTVHIDWNGHDFTFNVTQPAATS